jgi:hypothetical protein
MPRRTTATSMTTTAAATAVPTPPASRSPARAAAPRAASRRRATAGQPQAPAPSPGRARSRRCTPAPTTNFPAGRRSPALDKIQKRSGDKMHLGVGHLRLRAEYLLQLPGWPDRLSGSHIASYFLPASLIFLTLLREAPFPLHLKCFYGRVKICYQVRRNHYGISQRESFSSSCAIRLSWPGFRSTRAFRLRLTLAKRLMLAGRQQIVGSAAGRGEPGIAGEGKLGDGVGSPLMGSRKILRLQPMAQVRVEVLQSESFRATGNAGADQAEQFPGE